MEDSTLLFVTKSEISPAGLLNLNAIPKEKS